MSDCFAQPELSLVGMSSAFQTLCSGEGACATASRTGPGCEVAQEQARSGLDLPQTGTQHARNQGLILLTDSTKDTVLICSSVNHTGGRHNIHSRADSGASQGADGQNRTGTHQANAGSFKVMLHVFQVRIAFIVLCVCRSYKSSSTKRSST